jgi:hypothetical protein
MKAHSFNPAVFELACLRMSARAEQEGITPEQAFGYLLNSYDIEKANIPVSDTDIEMMVADAAEKGIPDANSTDVRTAIISRAADRIADIFEMHSFIIAQQIKLGATCEV